MLTTRGYTKIYGDLGISGYPSVHFWNGFPSSARRFEDLQRIKSDGEIFQGGQASSPFGLSDSGSVFIVSRVAGVVQFVLDPPVLAVVSKEFMRSRTFWIPAGNTTDGLLVFFIF